KFWQKMTWWTRLKRMPVSAFVNDWPLSACTVLDPFIGSGTTGMVATELGRQWVGIELSPEYAEMARKRTAQLGLFSEDYEQHGRYWVKSARRVENSGIEK
ncbi:MAG TPA: DNA methyltransferase, partial [Anaerolineae bacterium]|nr:DNA methyltransferase [Anaerolineae bacterium]